MTDSRTRFLRAPRAAARWVPSLAVIAAVILVSATAHATLWRRPFNTGHPLGYGYDHNFGAAGCSDYECRGRCYNGHTGSDFSLPMGTDIVAAAGGVVDVVSNSCANTGYVGNPCGGRCGNYIRIRHDDGARSLYCHMQRDSFRVSVGTRVNCGQVVGRSASSGSSSGPHLHFSPRSDGSTGQDPYRGSCSRSVSLWTDQRAYDVLPGTGCERSCDCDPGARASRDCGRCGSQSRTCRSDCTWGGWGDCTGQGPCSPGASQTEDCCDCGTRTRSCNNSCAWRSWSGCAGPDPADNKECAADALGVCSVGNERCIEGCLTCVQTIEPSAETCDGRDNDCNGDTDEGEPREMGMTTPEFAARLVDFGVPATVHVGEPGEAWAAFENVGSERWRAGGIWLGTGGAAEGVVSPLQDPDSWAAWDVAAVLHANVEPGAVGVFTWRFAVSVETDQPVTERFLLLDPSGAAVGCPEPAVDVVVRADGAVVAAAGADDDILVPVASGDAGPGAEAESDAGTVDAGTVEVDRDDATSDPAMSDTAVTDVVSSDVGLGSGSGRSNAGCATVSGHTPGASGWFLLALVGLVRRARASRWSGFR